MLGLTDLAFTSMSCMKSVNVWMRKSTHLRKFASLKSPSFRSFRASSPLCFLNSATVKSSKLAQVSSQPSKCVIQ